MKTKLIALFFFLHIAFGAKTQVNLQSGLVAYYPFNSNANDESGNGNNGTVNGATLTTDRFGNAGKAYNFNGISDYIKVPNSSSIDITTNKISMCAWVKISNGNYTNQIISKAQDVVTRKYGMYTGNNESRLGFEINTTNGVSDKFSENVQFEQWHYLATTYDGNNLNWFIDGVVVKTFAWSGNIVSSTTDLTIGCFSNLTLSFFKGSMDEVRIYNRSLSSDEVTQLYNSEKPATDLTTGLVAYYPFNGNANDESGNGNNGTVNGATLTTDRFGNVGKAYSFGGVDNYIQIDKLGSNNFANDFSVSCWVNFASFSTTYPHILNGDNNFISISGCGQGYSSDLYKKLGFYYELRSDPTVQKTHSINPINENQYYFITAIKKGGNISLYLNGEIQQTSINPNQIVTGSYVRIGNATPSTNPNVGMSSFNGSIDEMRIYNRALSSDEVTQLYNSEKPATDLTSGLVAYYPFNGNANDESGNGNNGTVNGATLTTDRFGNVGRAYNFDGVNDNISFSKVPMQNTDNWCISSWVNAKTLNTIQTILLLGVDNGNGGNASLNGYSIGTGFTGTLSSFVSIFSDIAPINSGSELSTNQWYSLIIQRVNGVTNFYINGVKTNSTSTATPRTPTEFFIGSSTGIRYFNGKIDDVRIYNRPLSSDEITQLYNSEKPATDLNSGLVAYYPFNGNANDESGNGNNGTVNGATLSTDRFGNVGKAYTFDGVKDYISSSFQNLSSIAISFWFKAPIQSNDYSCFVDCHKQFYCMILGPSYLATNNYGKVFCRANANNDIYSLSTYNDDSWNHVCIAFDNNSGMQKMYINGSLINSNSISSIGTLNQIFIGRQQENDASTYFKGCIDDIRIYNRALSEEEIKYLFSGQVTSNLLAPDGIEFRNKKLENSANYKTTILWKAATNAKLYEVYKNDVLIGKTFSTIYYDENPDGNYKYQIVSVNGSGKSPRSLSCNVSVSGTNTISGYGSMAIYITDVNKQKVENALIQFSDGSTAQTLKTGFVLLKNIPYGTTKTITSIVKSGWDFAPLNGSTFTCSQSKQSIVFRYLASPTPENEPSMETFNPQYSSDLVIVSEGDITLPTFTKGQDFTLDLKIASTSEYWWNGNIRLKVIRKDVVVDKTYPTYYIAQLNDVKVPQDGKMIRFTANASQLNAEAGNYELYVEAQTKEVFRQGYFIVKKGKATTSTTNSDAQYKTDISVTDNTGVVTGTETLFKISDYIKQGTDAYKMFGDLIELDNRTVLKGELGHDIIIDYGWGNVAVKPIAEINDKIQFFKDMVEIAKEPDETTRMFKVLSTIVDLSANGDPIAKIFKSYIDVAESMKNAIYRIRDGYNDATNSLIINELQVYLKIKKNWTGWEVYKNFVGGDVYFNASEFNKYISNIELFSSNSNKGRINLPIDIDSDPTRLWLKTNTIADLNFDTGETLFLKIILTNKRSIIIPLTSKFVKYEGSKIIVALGTNTTNPNKIPQMIKIIEP